MKTDEVKNFLERAIARVNHADCHLLVVDAHERSIAARLAMYLQEDFVGYDVDVEYNRTGSSPKKILPRRVFPDVVVHQRGHNKSNLLAIEMKKSSSLGNEAAARRHIKCICKRLKGFQNQLGYKFGALVVCTTGNHPKVCLAEFLLPMPKDLGGV